MSIKKTDKGWNVDSRPNGEQGKRYRKTFETKAEALRYESWLKTNKTVSPEWEPKSRADKRKLSELIELWHSKHGQYLKSGKNRLLMLNNLCKRLGNPKAEEIKPSDFTVYRNERLASGVSKNTVNNEQVYISSMFNELIRLEEWQKENPIKNIRQLKLDDKELDYLTTEQIKELLAELKKSTESDCYHIALLCLATGARWSEAENIEDTDIKNNTITYRATKNGKNRTVPLSSEVLEQLPRREGRLFKYGYSTLKRRIKSLSFTLQKGQLSHIFRHTFASHFIMNGGNILVLQKILGHGSLLMTMRYSHLAPNHFEEAAKLNPIDFKLDT